MRARWNLLEAVDIVKRECQNYMKIGAVWQFFEAERRGKSIALFEPSAGTPVHTFHFQRQRVKDKLCLSDYILPAVKGERDHVALFVVTAGKNILAKAPKRPRPRGVIFSRTRCRRWRLRRPRLARSGCTDAHPRGDWGFPDPASMTMQDRFTSRYRGKRYSFGYPACPRLEDQCASVATAEAGGNRRPPHRGDDDGSGG